MSHVTPEPAHELLIAEPGALRLRREVDVTPDVAAATAKAGRVAMLAQAPRVFARGWWSELLPGVPHGWRLIRTVTIVGLVLASPFAFFMSSWTPLLAGALLYPLGWLLAVVALTVLALVVMVREVRAAWRGESFWLRGPMTVEVYDRLVHVDTERGQYCVSQVTGVKDRGRAVRFDAVGFGTASVPSIVATAGELEHLVGGPRAAWPSDGGPEVRMTPAWFEEQRRQLPQDGAGEHIRKVLDAVAKAERPTPDDRSGIVPAALRYDVTTRELLIPRVRARFTVEGASFSARGGVGVLTTEGAELSVIPIAALPAGHLRALIAGIEPERCDVDIVLDGERLVRNAWEFEPGGEGGLHKQVDMADPAALEAHVRDAQRRAIARARGDDAESAHHPDAQRSAAAGAEARPQPRNGRATTALVLSIVGLPFIVVALFALFQGYKARREIRNAAVPLRGMGRAKAAIVLGWIGALWPPAYGIWLGRHG